MGKQVQFDDQAREALRRGVDQLANAVRVTLGPRGRNVVIDRQHGSPTITNDGVTIAEEIELSDPFENLGAQLIREVASKTAQLVGDGTTTATVLAQGIISRGLRAVVAGANPMQLKRGIEAAVQAVVEQLARQARPVNTREEISQIAAVAANNDAAIGRLLGEAMEKVGREGIVSVEEARGIDTTLELLEGMQLERGYLSPYFVTDPEEMTVVLEDAWVLLSDQKFAAVDEMLPVLDLVARSGRPLVVMGEDVEGDALATLVVNKLRGTLACVAVRAPEFGDQRSALMEDLAVLTGGRVISREAGLKLESLTARDLGRVKRVVVDRDRTTFIEGAGQSRDIRARLAMLQRQLEDSTSDYDKDRLKERIGKLTGGVAVIRVGAATEIELKEKKARAEDALAAVRSAVEEGVVPGGGVAFLRAQAGVRSLRLRGDAKIGADLVLESLTEPCRQIAANAGAEGPLVVARVQQGKGAFGFNAVTGAFEDLEAAGILDPAKVARVGLQNAASIGAMVLTTDALVVEVEGEEEQEGEETAE